MHQNITPESIARAKQHQQAERQRVTEATGIPISDDGVLVRPRPYLLPCPRTECGFVGSARTYDGAVRSTSAHLVGTHLRAVK